MAERRSGRVLQACDQCRRRKRACDENTPCASCRKSGYQCTYGIISTVRSPNEAIRLAQRAPPQPSTIPSSSQQTSAIQTDSGILSEVLPKYVKTTGVAFPRILGLELKAERPPRLHAYGYNLGLREEEISLDYGTLPINVDEARQYVSVAFEIPLDIVDREWLDTKINDYYQAPQSHAHLGSVIGGMFAIGSALSTSGHPSERQVVKWCKSVLEDPGTTRKISMEAVLGYALRVWYLRTTTRPSCAWLASCMAVHLMEHVGLHREENIAKLVMFSSMSERSLRAMFCTIWAKHRILSLEYGRTPIELHVTTLGVKSQFLDLVESTSLDDLSKIEVSHPFLIYTKVDVAMFFFRESYQAKKGIKEDLIYQIADPVLDTADTGVWYFNTVGSIFQYACALLALRTDKALSKIGRVVQVLTTIAEQLDTHVVKEALATINSLLGLVIAKKREDLDKLDAIVQGGTSIAKSPASGSPDATFDFDFMAFDENWAADFDVEFPQ